MQRLANVAHELPSAIQSGNVDIALQTLQDIVLDLQRAAQDPARKPEESDDVKMSESSAEIDLREFNLSKEQAAEVFRKCLHAHQQQQQLSKQERQIPSETD